MVINGSALWFQYDLLIDCRRVCGAIVSKRQLRTTLAIWLSTGAICSLAHCFQTLHIVRYGNPNVNTCTQYTQWVYRIKKKAKTVACSAYKIPRAIWNSWITALVCECWLVGWLSGGFTPCRHLRPSSGREHTIVTYSVRWWWLLDEWN